MWVRQRAVFCRVGQTAGRTTLIGLLTRDIISVQPYWHYLVTFEHRQVPSFSYKAEAQAQINLHDDVQQF